MWNARRGRAPPSFDLLTSLRLTSLTALSDVTTVTSLRLTMLTSPGNVLTVVRQVVRCRSLFSLLVVFNTYNALFFFFFFLRATVLAASRVAIAKTGLLRQ